MWEGMDVHTSQVYFQAMEVLSAQEKLHELGASDWPNLKKEDRSRIHRDLHKAAYPATHDKITTPQELAKMLGAGRIK